MKYNGNNKPLICMQTQSTCYRGTKPMTVKGVLWHSTGANNPNLCRYIQPSDNVADRARMLELIGTNKYHNDINHKTRNMGMNAWIGKLADGSVAAVQTMPWNWAPWGCGAGKKGSCNSAWIQFEICEDGLNNRDYAMAVYREACELTAYLCRMYGLDPHGSVRFNGVDVPVILDHRTSHALELGNNHGDIVHWFPRFGKTLETIRDDVAALIGVDAPAEEPFYDDGPVETKILLGTRLLKKGLSGTDVAELQGHLIRLGYDLGKWGADGSFGKATDQAVRAFQKNALIDIDGICGPQTIGALHKALT